MSRKEELPSATYDAFQRLASGREARTLAEKMADPHRPTWEQYKKDNEDKLDNIGADMRKMAEYRAQLDREREERIANVRKRRLESDEDGEISSDNSGRKGKKKKKNNKKDKKHRKEKLKKKSKKKKRKHNSQSDEENYSSSSSDE